MNRQTTTHERMLELLCDRALEGLGPDEAAELHWLMAQQRGGADDASFDLAAARVGLTSNAAAAAPLPAHLAAKIAADAHALLAARAAPAPQAMAPQQMAPQPVPGAGWTQPVAQRGPAAAHSPVGAQQAQWPQSAPGTPSLGEAQTMLMPPPVPMAPLPIAGAQPVPIAPQPVGAIAPVVPLRRGGVGRWAGWLAAAACFALAVAGWSWPRPPRQVAASGIDMPRVPTVPTPPSPVDERARLLAAGAGVVQLDWSKTKDPAAQQASGDVVWSTAEQRGYMRFRGLDPNDRATAQYQLWIFDEAQDQRFPVDGGVFDVDPSTGDVVVAIDPKIKVERPTLFAITVEKPGGVVVSKRERIVLTAAVGKTG